MDSVHIGFA